MIKLFRRLRKREWMLVAASVLFIVAQVYLDLKMPDYMSEITQLTQTPGSAMRDIFLAGGKMLVCALGSMVASIIVGYFAARIAAFFSWRLRDEVFSKVQSFSLAEIERFSTASLITRSTNDVSQVQMVVAMGLQVMIKAPILAVWAVLKILGKSWEWSAATAVAVCVLLALIVLLLLLVMPKFRKMQTLVDNVNRITREHLTGLRVVRAYNAEQLQEEKFEQANKELTGTQLFTSRMMGLMNPVMSLVMNGLSLSIYWLGALLINAAAGPQKLTLFSDMVVFSSYAMQVVMAFMMLVLIFFLLPRASVSARRILEVLETPASILDGKKDAAPQGKRGSVEFRHVSFRYPGAQEDVLHDVSFTAAPGETVAFIGATGSGKSTLINLVPRFFDVSEGQVLVDGQDVREYTLRSLRNRLGYVTQRAVLFKGSVRENIAYGDNGQGPVSEETVKKALEIAQADFVANMPGGLDADLSQGGANVSGGQKQRLSIARAVARKPEIFIFDDSFSALDYKTDKALRARLRQETAGTTCLIVAQRIGTIRDADRIVVLEDGRMAGCGTHDELMKNCDVYREIALSQLSKEELENA